MTTPTPPEDQEPALEQQETPEGRKMPVLTRAQVTEALLKVIGPDPKP